MKAMILAAGFGTRLRPLTESLPKPLLPVGGLPLILWNLLLLREHGIHDVMINLHYLGHMIRQQLGTGERWGMRLEYSEESEILGTGGGLKAAEAFFDGEDFITLNGDTLIDLDLTDVLTCHASTEATVTMVLREDENVEQWGVIETTDDDRVLSITGRGCLKHYPSDTIHKRMFAGVHVLSPHVLRHCPEGQGSSIIDAYITELENGSRIMGYLASGYWSDVGTPERYDQAQRDIASGCLSRAL